MSRPTPRQWLAALFATIIATLTIAPPTASAGTYTVYSCTTPSGAWAGMGGWTSAASLPVAGRDNGSATPCVAAGGSFSEQFGATGLPVAAGSWISWTFDAPSGATINSYSISRTFNLGWPAVVSLANRPYALQAWHDADENSALFDFQAPLQANQTLTQGDPSVVTDEGLAWQSLHIGLRCWALVGTLDCGSFPAQVTIPRAIIGMTDTSAPVTTIAGGSLVGEGAVRGVGDLAFHASDAGSGVYRSIVSVDGAEVSRTVVDDGGGSCADAEPANDDPYEFTTPQPCPLETSGSVHLDTSGLPDGSHVLTVAVEDAAGNTDVVAEHTIVTHNAPIATRAPSLAGSTRVSAQLTVDDGGWAGSPNGYDRRWLRCDATGASCVAIAGAAGSTYALTPADAYHRIVAEVTAANASGAASARSAASAPIADDQGNVAPPGASGGAAAGGIAGLANPVASAGGHTPNGATPSGRPRLTLAFRLARGRTAQRVRSSSRRRLALGGTLVDGAGRPIAGARITVAWKVLGRGWHAHAVVRTSADGRFASTLPPGPTRTVKLVYYAYADSRTYISSNLVHEDALAPMTLRADPRRLVATRVVRLAGRVAGEPMPRGGLLVTLQGYQTGWGWRSFRTVRTTRSGRWRASYRFRLGHGRFGFRAIVPRQTGFPFATSSSRATFVTVG
jgi:hypothetical protein